MAARELFRRAAEKAQGPFEGNERLWRDVMKELGFARSDPTMLVAVMRVIADSRWQAAHIKNPSAWIRTAAKRDAERHGLGDVPDYRLGRKAEAAAKRIPEIEARFRAGEIKASSYERELRKAQQDIDSDIYAGPVSQQRPVYDEDGKKLGYEDWIDRQQFRDDQSRGNDRDDDTEGRIRHRLEELGLDDSDTLCDWNEVARRAGLDAVEHGALLAKSRGQGSSRHARRKLELAMPAIVNTMGGTTVPFSGMPGPRLAPPTGYHRTGALGRGGIESFTVARRSLLDEAIAEGRIDRRPNGRKILQFLVDRIEPGQGVQLDAFIETVQEQAAGRPWQISVKR